jgi:hypothetical protein
MQDTEQQIRERAYQLWAEGGCQDGRAEIHWLTAQREILSASLGEIARVSATPPVKSAKPKAKRSQKKQRAA